MSTTTNREEIVAAVDELISSVEAGGDDMVEVDLTSAFKLHRKVRHFGDEELAAAVKPVMEAIMLEDRDQAAVFAAWRSTRP